MNISAEQIYNVIKEEMRTLHNEQLALSSDVYDDAFPMSNNDYSRVFERLQRKLIIHNQYLELQKLLNIIDAMEVMI